MTHMIRSNHFRLLIGVAVAFGAGWLGRGVFVETPSEEENNPPHLKPVHQSDGSIKTPRSQERPSTVPSAPLHNASARELMARASAITNGAEQARYLRGLVAAWIRDDQSLSTDEKEAMLRSIEDGSFRGSNGIMSDAVELSGLVAKLADPEIREAWKQAHASNPVRSEIFSRFASADVGEEHPGHLLDAAAGWTAWKKGS